MKNEIRNLIKLKRRDMEISQVEKKSISAEEKFIGSHLYKKSKCIMIYSPLGNEIRTDLIFEKAYADGKMVVVPVTDSATGEISPCKVGRETEYIVGGFGILEPKDKSFISSGEIDVVIVPGIAFDKKGARIGFGKGCYDKFLKGMSAVKVGFCYDFQLVEGIPADDFDIPMDFLVTNEEILNCQK